VRAWLRSGSLEDADDKDANRTVVMNAQWSKLTVGKFGFFLVLATHH
jgi:hypothetical protein